MKIQEDAAMFIKSKYTDNTEYVQDYKFENDDEVDL